MLTRAQCGLILLLGAVLAGAASADSVDTRLAAELLRLGFEGGKLPPLPKAFGTYEPYVVVDKKIYLTSAASQRPNGEWIRGIVSTEVSLQVAFEASELSCIHAINRLKHAADGDLKKIGKITHVNYMTAAPMTYPHLSEIANYCSDMLVRVFGERVGRHTRTVFAVPSFPWNLTQEVEVMAVLK